MRRFRFGTKLDWKYILVEILLIFVGINLAIWFNNWNSSRHLKKDKEIAITQIQNEIQSNLDEINSTESSNNTVRQFLNEYANLYSDDYSYLITSPDIMATIKTDYPDALNVLDSIALENGKYRYRGNTLINVKLGILSEIAWKTAQSTGITNEFDYEFLYDLESLYHLQSNVQSEFDKAALALQERNLNQLAGILNFSHQLTFHLSEKYRNILEKMNGL